MLKIEYLLTLIEIPSLKVRIRSIAGTTDTGISSLPDLLDWAKYTCGTAMPVLPLSELERAYNKALRIIEDSQKQGIVILSPYTGPFPQVLARIPAPPLVLYAKGNIRLLDRAEAVAVIGTTEPSPAAQDQGKALTTAIALNGFCIVSGLARGCDTIAHETCLEYNSPTIAVLAHGLDYCYPAQNRPLARAIVEKQGLLVSEYRPGIRPRPGYFVVRDRLQSGLSRAVCVIETGVSGGTMYTVRFAEKQGRMIGCIDSQAEGNRLLIDGKRALPLGSPQSIYAFIEAIKTGTERPAARSLWGFA
ncbi:MAG: DNA-protecting protein DprA [Treponema sp.]|jgi:DNA processing protein|nr:DNA-protecting protein DprA [Treponema sp.]